MTVERMDAVVHGRVQGVGFRVFALRRAASLGLGGWVANESGGTVRCVADGDRADLEDLLSALRDGPPGALVDRVDVRWGPAPGAVVPFTIRASAHPGD